LPTSRVDPIGLQCDDAPLGGEHGTGCPSRAEVLYHDCIRRCYIGPLTKAAREECLKKCDQEFGRTHKPCPTGPSGPNEALAPTPGVAPVLPVTGSVGVWLFLLWLTGTITITKLGPTGPGPDPYPPPKPPPPPGSKACCCLYTADGDIFGFPRYKETRGTLPGGSCTPLVCSPGITVQMINLKFADVVDGACRNGDKIIWY
jgi:hypothetical protein